MTECPCCRWPYDCLIGWGDNSQLAQFEWCNRLWPIIGRCQGEQARNMRNWGIAVRIYEQVSQVCNDGRFGGKLGNHNNGINLKETTLFCCKDILKIINPTMYTTSYYTAITQRKLVFAMFTSWRQLLVSYQQSI